MQTTIRHCRSKVVVLFGDTSFFTILSAEQENLGRHHILAFYPEPQRCRPVKGERSIKSHKFLLTRSVLTCCPVENPHLQLNIVLYLSILMTHQMQSSTLLQVFLDETSPKDQRMYHYFHVGCDIERHPSEVVFANKC